MDEKKRKKEKKSHKEKKQKKSRPTSHSAIDLDSDSEKEYRERKNAQSVSGNDLDVVANTCQELIQDIESLENRKTKLEESIKEKEQEKKEVLLRLQLLDPSHNPEPSDVDKTPVHKPTT
jgi:ABC-type uncharacterized transport system involved in gliding motility auxiliary subunit